MKNIKVKAGFVVREYSLGNSEVQVISRNAPFMVSVLDLPNTLEWVVSYKDLGLDQREVEIGLKRMEDGELVQNAFPSLTEDQIEMLLDHPDFRLSGCQIVD